jgi:hypothetical protein
MKKSRASVAAQGNVVHFLTTDDTAAGCRCFCKGAMNYRLTTDIQYDNTAY